MKIQYIGTLIILGLLVFGVWKAVVTKNWGEFNKTSFIVWGSVIVLALGAVGLLSALS